MFAQLTMRNARGAIIAAEAVALDDIMSTFEAITGHPEHAIVNRSGTLVVTAPVNAGGILALSAYPVATIRDLVGAAA